MKVRLGILVLVALLGATLSAAPSKGGLTPYVDKGEFLASAGIGWGGLSGGAELTLARIDIADILPLTFGAAGRAFVDPGIFYSSYASLTLGVGGFGTAHVGFKKLDLPDGLSWVSNFDAYVGLGLGFAMALENSDYADYGFKPGIGISTFEGVSYYLNDNLALTAEYGYIGRVGYDNSWGKYSWPLYYSTFGVTLKL